MASHIDIDLLFWDRNSNKLTGEASMLRHSLQGQIQSGNALAIVGHRETRLYALHEVEREKAHNEVGDIQAWVYKPVRSEGPSLIIFND